MPGVDAVYGAIHCRSARMSLTAGIAPDVGTLELPLSAAGKVPLKADLTLSDGKGGTVRLKEVYALEGTSRLAPDGKAIAIQVADRRCLWNWTKISGVYNQPNPDGSENQEQSADVLIALCFSFLPGNRVIELTVGASKSIYPPVRWDAENPAQAAQELCDELGLVISVGPDGRPSVSQLTQDVAWPAGSNKEREATAANVLKPAEILIVGAPVVNEKTFEGLVPVGLEADGTIRPINDLSYKPAHGWSTEPITFPNLSGGTYNGTAYTANEARELAKKALWRWYAITGDDRDLLPLLDVRSEVVSNQGTEEHGRPYVLSENARWDGTSWARDAKGRISSGFTLDTQAGIVKFGEPVYDVTTEGGAHGGLVAPDIDLRAAYEKKANTGAPLNYEWSLPIAGGVQGTSLVHRVPELRAWDIEDAGNWTDQDAYAYKVALRLAEQFKVQGPQARVYPRIVNLAPKGTIRSVQWSVDGQGGAVTVVQKNFDRPDADGMPTYEEKLTRRRQRVLLDRHERESRRSAADSAMGIGAMQGGAF